MAGAEVLAPGAAGLPRRNQLVGRNQISPFEAFERPPGFAPDRLDIANDYGILTGLGQAAPLADFKSPGQNALCFRQRILERSQSPQRIPVVQCLLCIADDPWIGPLSYRRVQGVGCQLPGDSSECVHRVRKHLVLCGIKPDGRFKVAYCPLNVSQRRLIVGRRLGEFTY